MKRERGIKYEKERRGKHEVMKESMTGSYNPLMKLRIH
jgi:hypothetical protein